MNKGHPVPLQVFIYRTLSIRLAAMAVFIGLATAAAIYVLEGQSLRSLVAEEARASMQLLVIRTGQIIRESKADRRSAFHQALNERLSAQLKREHGQFIYSGFQGLEGKGFEERYDSHYDLIEPVLRYARSYQFSISGPKESAEIVSLGGRMHVHVVMPMEDLSQRKVGIAQAVFAPSESMLINMKKKLERSVGLAVLIVLVTSALLYPVILHLFSKLAIFSRNLLDANLEALSLLASTIAKRDRDTDVHNFRVTLYSVRLAEILEVPADDMQTLIKGAFLHDVGKIGIRDNILLKPGGLDEDEFNGMKEHVRHGLDIVSTSVWLKDAAIVVGSHHEKYDGSGYPAGTCGDEIPLLARIFAIADVFDALTSRRPYKEPISYQATMDVLQKGSGTHFDPLILNAFMGISLELYSSYAGRDDQGLRDEQKAVVTRYFSKGEILLY